EDVGGCCCCTCCCCFCSTTSSDISERLRGVDAWRPLRFQDHEQGALLPRCSRRALECTARSPEPPPPALERLRDCWGCLPRSDRALASAVGTQGRGHALPPAALPLSLEGPGTRSSRRSRCWLSDRPPLRGAS